MKVGIADHLFRMKVDAKLPTDDTLTKDNVYVVALLEQCYKEQADI